jgi:hypothetical protein
MLNLIYLMHIGPAAWPVHPITAYAMAYEVIAETAALWGYILTGMIRRIR